MDLNSLMYKALTEKPETVLDSVQKEQEREQKCFDAADEFVDQDLRLNVVSAIHDWLETEDGEDVSLADALNAELIDEIVDPEGEELTDDEADLLQAAIDEGYDYLVSNGVSEDDAEALLVDLDDDAAVRVRDLLVESLPDGEEALDAVTSYVFGEPVLDATYKKVAVVKNGKKIFRNKRLSRTVRLSAKRKQAIKKMQLKARSGAAKMHRKRSMAIRRKLGIKSLKRR